MSSRSMNVVFTKIGFVIQKGLTAQFIVRLSYILSVNNGLYN